MSAADSVKANGTSDESALSRFILPSTITTLTVILLIFTIVAVLKICSYLRRQHLFSRSIERIITPGARNSQHSAPEDSDEVGIPVAAEHKSSCRYAYDAYLEAREDHQRTTREHMHQTSRNCDDWSLVSLSPVYSPRATEDKKLNVEVEMHPMTRQGWINPTTAKNQITTTIKHQIPTATVAHV